MVTVVNAYYPRLHRWEDNGFRQVWVKTKEKHHEIPFQQKKSWARWHIHAIPAMAGNIK
jgi:hypothetical protein